MEHLPGADGDHNQQRSGEQVGGNHEDHAGVVDAAHVHDGQNEQHRQAELQGVRLQAGAAEMSAPTPAEMPTAAVSV